MKKLTTEFIVNEFNTTHNYMYDYSLTNYINARTKIDIICKKHGIFTQNPFAHKSGQGCPNCAYERLPQNNPKPKEQLISEFNKIHNNRYKYDLTSYKNKNSRIKIICPTHGELEIDIYTHKNNTGCELCDRFELFLKKAKKAHGEKYNYSLTKYYNSSTKITIICPIHNEFEQFPCSHLRGPGCPKCGTDLKINKLKENENSFRKSGFKSMAKDRICAFYIIRCFNGNESFYKIGITSHNIKNRFKKNKMPYNYEIIKEICGQAEHIWLIENYLKMNLSNHYIPLIRFGGSIRECFSDLNEIENLLISFS